MQSALKKVHFVSSGGLSDKTSTKRTLRQLAPKESAVWRYLRPHEETLRNTPPPPPTTTEPVASTQPDGIIGNSLPPTHYPYQHVSYVPRELRDSHFAPVIFQPVPSPAVLAYSRPAADWLSWDAETDLKDPDTVAALAGNCAMKGWERPIATTYGSTAHGHWWGQLGDGRAFLLGEVAQPTPSGRAVPENGSKHIETVEELSRLVDIQLKGAGKTPFSRGYDGRAALRSSLREFVASEAMHHLGCRTTRGVALLSTGQRIERMWYSDDDVPSCSNCTNDNVSSPYPPNTLIVEPGAILVRAARSFWRFGHLELLARRSEWANLEQLLAFIICREFPHIAETAIASEKVTSKGRGEEKEEVWSTTFASEKFPGHAALPRFGVSTYVPVFREIARRNAELVSQWQRVGFIHGSLHSDNISIAGRALDYGPFSFLESYSPLATSYTGDSIQRRYGFNNQFSAMGRAIANLGEQVFIPLLKATALDPWSEELKTAVDTIRMIGGEEWEMTAENLAREVHRKKLGLESHTSITDETLWMDLCSLMEASGADFTIFFRELEPVLALAKKALVTGTNEDAVNVALNHLSKTSFGRPLHNSKSLTSADMPVIEAWKVWLRSYLARSTNQVVPDRRQTVMETTNPKYILRSWMAHEATVAITERNDPSILHNLMSVLERPYTEQGAEVNSRWYRQTPEWAKDKPGVAFFDCSS